MSSVGSQNPLIKQEEMWIAIYIHILISTHVKARSLTSTRHCGNAYPEEPVCSKVEQDK